MRPSRPLRALPRAGVLPLATVLALAAGGAWAQARDPGGLWLTETSGTKVRLSRCGGGYCGTIASTAGSGLDQNNPDPALRGRSVVGVRIVNAPTASGGGYEGTLYNPTDGKTYSGSLRMTGPDSLEVAGCVLGVFCKRQTWKRVN